MPWPLRLVAIIAAAALTVAGTVVALASIGDRLIHNAATVAAIHLPPLSDGALQGSTVYADDGSTVLAVLHGPEDRKPIPLTKVSKVLVTAVLDTEDHNFFLHGGIDIPSIARALVADSGSSGGLQGGSTIAQQLVKLTYLSSERTLSRKVKEAVLAERLEHQYTKDQILEAYLNSVYLGSGAYGVEAASYVYFGRHANQLNIPQAALLAGLIQDPSGDDPILDPAAARARRSEVLARMVHYHDITPKQSAAANATPLPTSEVTPPTQGDKITDYYVQQVENQLLGDSSPLGGTKEQRYQELFEGGLKIYTNLDPGLQAEAEQSVAADAPSGTPFQEAMVAIDPTTGKVRAMVGGTGVQNSDFNLVTQGTRQPGSGFKVFTLLAALEQGYSIYDTVDTHSPCAIDFPTDHDLISNPAQNDSGPGGGVTTVINSTAQSINCAYIRMAHEAGLANVINVAHQLGISETLPPYPSIVIGSIAVHPIEMASAYATLANNGVYHAPIFIDHIVDGSGSTVWSASYHGQQVVPAQIAEEANVAFQAVVQYGTGTAAELYGRQVAGKTGTTSSNVDAWFNGYTPQLEATVWMGDPRGEVPMVNVGGYGAVYGADFPARTWHDFMASALSNLPTVSFTPPDFGLLPAPKYITSPGLVQADVLDHNFAPPSTLPPAPPPAKKSPGTTVPKSPPTTKPPGPPGTVPKHGGGGGGGGHG